MQVHSREMLVNHGWADLIAAESEGAKRKNREGVWALREAWLRTDSLMRCISAWSCVSFSKITPTNRLNYPNFVERKGPAFGRPFLRMRMFLVIFVSGKGCSVAEFSLMA